MSHTSNTLPFWKSRSCMLAIAAVCGVFSGCELDRPNFQMNSNSPTPFFGFDLLPRRKTTSIVSPQAGQQVASSPHVTGDIETVSQVPGRPRFSLWNAKTGETNQNAIVLPLSKTNPDQPIDRGPVELLP
jgi:hypothetical protein